MIVNEDSNSFGRLINQRMCRGLSFCVAIPTKSNATRLEITIRLLRGDKIHPMEYPALICVRPKGVQLALNSIATASLRTKGSVYQKHGTIKSPWTVLQRNFADWT